MKRVNKPPGTNRDKADNRSPGQGGAGPSRTRTARQRWGFRLLAAGVVPVFLLLAVEMGLRLAGYGYEPGFFRSLRISGEEFRVQNDAFSFRFFPPETVRHPGALRMRALKTGGAIRIFVLGESAAMGDPEPAYGPARYMEALLSQRHPGVSFEVVNVAFTAINSHVILPIARECAAHDGDVWILYLGNNEMVGPFGASSAFGRQAPPLWQVRASLTLQRLRLGQLLNTGVRRLRGGKPDFASWGGMEMFLENRVGPQDPKRAVVHANFRRNLQDIVRAGLESDARVVLCTVAVNLKDCPPFASMPDPGLSEADAGRFSRLLADARIAATNDQEALALQHYAEAATLDPGHAALQFEWGSLLLQQSNRAAARPRLQAACDQDALAFRTDSHLNRIIRQVASTTEDPHLHLLDAEAQLAALAGVPLNGSESFYEHVHFNFNGAYRLGLLWARQAEAALAERLEPSKDAWASQEECEAFLGLTDWNRVLVLNSMRSRLNAPPLNHQPNNRERMNALEKQVRELKSSLTNGAVEAARQRFATAIARSPDEPLLHEVHGNFLQVIGDLEGAIAAWQRARDLLPHDFLAPFQIGVLYARSCDPAGAEVYFREALAIRPSLEQGWVELARSLEARREWAAALAAFDRARRLRPADPRIQAHRAKSLAALGRPAEAIEACRTALELQPDFAEARMELARLYVDNGNLSAAAEQYRAVVRSQPDETVPRLNLGVVLLQQGDVAGAIGAFRETLRIDPDNETAHRYLQRVQAGGAP